MEPYGSGLRIRTSSDRVKADRAGHYTSPEFGAQGEIRTHTPVRASGFGPDAYPVPPHAHGACEGNRTLNP